MKTIQDAVDALNSMLEHDGLAISRLVGHRVGCNDRLAGHPTAQVGARGDGFEIGMLGVLNGIFAEVPNGAGPIAAEVDGGGKVVRFLVYRPAETDQ